MDTPPAPTAPVSPVATAPLVTVPCPTCAAPVHLAASLHPDLTVGCAGCCAWLGNGIPPWMDQAGHCWWLDVRDSDRPIATLSYVMADGKPLARHATHRLRCAGLPPAALVPVREDLAGHAYLVIVEPGDWRYPLSGGAPS